MIIEEIKTAEEQAENIVAQAKKDARAILTAAETEIEALEAAAKADALSARAAVIERAEAQARAEFDAATKKGQEQAAKYIADAADKLDSAADTIVGSVMNGNR